jgi:hypothetical protein
MIVVCIVLMVSQDFFGEEWDKNNGTLILESLALIFFGSAWLVKGKFWGVLADEK